MTNWFTSDTHFDHANCARYCDRPFANWGGVLCKPSEVPFWDPDNSQILKMIPIDVDEMNQTLINNWNSKVKDTDTVYHIGDFHLGKRHRIAHFRRQLNGRIVLVRGNHDRSKSAMLDAGFDEVVDSLVIEAGALDPEFQNTDWVVSLQHKPPDLLDKIYHDPSIKYHLHGHVHDLWRYSGNRINVGVDAWNLYPMTLKELIDGLAL